MNFKTIYKGWKELQSLFILPSKPLKNEFYTTIAHENFIRVFFVSMFYLLFEIYLIVTVPQPLDDRLRIVSTFIVYFHIAAIVISVWYIKNREKVKVVSSQWIISIYCIVLLYWAVSVSLVQISRVGSITMFILTLTGTSALFYRKMLITLATNFGVYIYFSYNVRSAMEITLGRPPGPGRGPGIIKLYISDAFLITGICCILGLIIFRLRLSVFLEKKALEELALKDAMTGVMNHRSICDVLEKELHRSKRYDLPLSVLIIDIDHFKGINDTYGHQFGDQVIKQVAKLITINCRETDFVGRYGGEEFLVILTNTERDMALELCERLRDNIENVDFGNSCNVTVSCGLKNRIDETDEELIYFADKALYNTKAKGRNRVECI